MPFPNVEFQALLTEIAAAKPDAVYAFFAGGGAVKFVKDYAAAGLNKTIPLYGPGFLTDGTLEAQGDAAAGHADHAALRRRPEHAARQRFRTAYAKTFKLQPDVYAVQGYDAAQMLAHRPHRGEGRHLEEGRVRRAPSRRPRSTARAARSRCSKAHNPVQDIYLRKVEGKENKLVNVAVKSLADPARGCKL